MFLIVVSFFACVSCMIAIDFIRILYWSLLSYNVVLYNTDIFRGLGLPLVSNADSMALCP